MAIAGQAKDRASTRREPGDTIGWEDFAIMPKEPRARLATGPPCPVRPRSSSPGRGWRFALAASLAGVGGSPAAAAPPLDHVIVVVMENRAYDTVVSQPYISSMISRGVVFTSSFAIRHPSQPNYVALWSGSTQGSTSDACVVRGSPFTAENLGHACEVAGLRWRAYSEDLPWAGSDTCRANDLYARKHAPWTQFGNLDHLNERPYTDLALDIANRELPELAFVVPNLCNDMHSCPTARGDAWLADNVPAMLEALGPNDLLVLTWDEADHSGDNHILTAFLGGAVKPGFAVADTINHYTVLRAICEGLGLTPFMAAASEPTIANAWVDRNLVANPSFEASTDGWIPYQDAAIARVPGGSDGAYALEIQGPPVAGPFGVDDAPEWVGPGVAAGARYRFTAWVRSAAGTGSAQLQIGERVGPVRQGAPFRSPTASLSPAWQMLSVDYVVTNPGAALDFQVIDDPGAPGEAFQVDAVSIVLAGADRPPLVAAPAAQGAEGSRITMNVTAVDPDRHPIDRLTADLSALPPGDAVFRVGPGNASGTLTWTPSFADGGRSYPVSFTASNTLTGARVTTISVANVNRPPRASLAVTPAAGPAPLTVTADASASTDPDGPLAGYTFDFGDGTVVGPQSTPGATHVFTPGVWTVTVRVDDGDGGADAAAVRVNASFNMVTNGSFESSLDGWRPSAGATLARVPGGYDGDWALEVRGPASLASFEANDVPNWVGVVVAGRRYHFTAWVRSAAGSGSASLRIREFLNGLQVGNTVRSPAVRLLPEWQMLAADPVAATAGGTFDFQLTDTPAAPAEVFDIDAVAIEREGPDLAPVVTAPPYAIAPTGVPIGLTVMAADPDGDPIGSLGADLAGLPPGNDARFTADPAHHSGRLTWTPRPADLGRTYPVTFTATNGRSGSAATPVSVIAKRPPHAAPAVTPGAGAAQATGGTRDTTGTSGAGPAASDGALASPPDAADEAGGMRASVSPNPVASEGALSFTMRRPGLARVELFDVRGRCVRTLLDGLRPGGRHALPLDGRDDTGAPLPAGMYYYRLRTAEGSTSGRFLLLP